MKRLFLVLTASIAVLCMSPSAGLCDYHHGGENDSPNFLAVYPDKAGSKVDSCALCHTGGSYKNDSGKTVTLGSCQWCHYKYGINAPHGDVLQTLNSYGTDYLNHGRGKSAISAIEGLDSDGDGYTNLAEILASSYPGDATDNPSKVSAPSRIYTRAQLMALPQHTQFLLMNTTRQVDSYATYTGVPMKDLLDDAGILPGATGIMVFAPDGFSMSHPLEYDASVSTNYHVYGNDPRAPAGQSYQYPPATYYYDPQADVSLNQASGWCDYTSPACAGRSNGDSITVTGGLNAILAIQREGAFLDTGVLNTENTLDGEGPFRVVVPQKNPGPPDQSKTSSVQAVKWPFDGVNGDHNAGACTRSVTIIKVLPLPAGTTDINTMEAGWAYVDSNKIVVYGAIEGSDSNGNGILDSEEHVPGTDYYNDPSSAYPRHAKGTDHVLIHTLKGALANVQVMSDDDPGISQTGKPSLQFPYGAFKFQITGLSAGESVTLAMTFPKAVPSGSHYYKISPAGAWTEVPFTQGSDNKTIMMTLKDGDPATDADGQVNGTILDPGALGTPAESSSSGGGGLCFITMSSHGPWNPHAWMTLSLMLLLLVGSWLRIRSHSSE